MADNQLTLKADAITGRGNTINPFVIVEGAADFMAFAEEVFDAREVTEVRTPTPTGKLIHAELRFGDSLVLVVDVQEGWRAHPGLFQIWIGDIETVLRRAVDRGSVIVTPPTPFYGSLTLARVEDPWGNLWWVYQPTPGQPDPKPVWEGGSDTVFRTIDEYMRSAR
ncbi:VOC family protein [Glycomyces arizonensis]|uniref:VOC family protein n=1 Tax=Glycomyces arizonensis TaxID=256035 RepID=UPI0003F6AD40|nr:VOC family protein [Glycomyces arizonensis]